MSADSPANAPRRRSLDPTVLVYLIYTVFTLYWFRIYFSTEPIAAVDLPGHLAGIEGLRRHFFTLSYVYFDISCFTGYPAFQFYAFLVHWLCALFSFPLSLFTDDPVRLSAHVLLVFGMVTLPAPIIWSVKPILQQLFDEDEEKVREARWWVAVSSCMLSFWFINHDYQWWGIGAAAVMNIGLFSQAFGWHFMILHFGGLLRLLKEGRQNDARLVAILFATLFLIHSMTAIFSFYLAFMAFAWFRERRALLVKAHAQAFLLMSFWLVPMYANLSSYTGLDIHRPQGDFLEIMLRYPFFAILRTLRSFLYGRLELFGAAEPLMVFLMATFGFHRFTKKSPLLVAFMIFEIFGLFILQQPFIATSIPMGFHYYRFVAYLLLFYVVLLAIIPVYFLKETMMPGRPRWVKPALTLAMLGAFTGAWVTTAILQHNEREKVAKTANRQYLATEFQVLDHFKKLPEKGRVLFEYFSDYNKYPFLSCHFMSTRLLKDTGFEPINGLFVQSSMAYHFPMGSANLLKANTYNGPLLFPSKADLTDDAKIQQLREAGVTHIVVGGEEFLGKVKPYAVSPPVQIGIYTIVQILEHPPARVKPVNKHVAAYVDLRGNLSYKFMELYFYSKVQLTQNWEVISVKPGDDLPPQVEVIILNGSDSDTRSTFEKMSQRMVEAGGKAPSLLALDYNYFYLIHHYSVWYQHNPEIDDYDEVAKYLDGKPEMKSVLAATASPADAGSEQFQWEPGNQTYHLSGLKAGQLYHVAYSHTPFWYSWDAKVFRATADRMIVWAKGDQATVAFSRFASRSTWLGYLLSAVGLWWWLSGRKNHPILAPA